MNIFSTAARLRFSLWAGLAAGLFGTVTLAPSPTHNASTALTSVDAPALDLCTETLFTGFPAIAASTMPAIDEQLTNLACADGGCIDPESVTSQPSAGGNLDDTLPETDEEIPVLASLAPLPDVPGLGDPDVTDDPNWIVAGQQSAGGNTGPGGNGGSSSNGGADGGGGSEEFVLLPGTAGVNTSPTNSSGDGADGGVDGAGNGSGGGAGGSGSGGSAGGGSGGGGSGSNGQGAKEGGEEQFPVQRLAAIDDVPAEVPTPATITLLGLGLVALARGKR